ncbi:polyol transporter 5-like protein [Tanacetum coccineum]
MADQKPEENGVSSKTKELADFDPPKPPKRNKYAFACAMLASMTSVLLGYDIGVMSGAQLFIQGDLNCSDTQIEILVGILNLYSLAGSAAAGRTSDWIGRRYTIVLAGVIFFAGAILMGFATNYAFLMFGRFVAGIGVGYALMIAPVYTAEVSPASARGFLTSFPEVFINAGILLGYVSNYAFSKLPLHLGWRFMLGIGAIPSIFLALGVLGMPESPRWLVMQGRLGDAKIVLDKTSDSLEESKLRLADIKAAAGIPEDCNDDIVQVSKDSHGGGIWKELLIHPTPTVRHILMAAIGIHFFQQASGIDAVVLYSPRIFEKAGIVGKTPKLLATIAVGFVKTIFILVATFFLDKVGRRPLLLSSVAADIKAAAGIPEDCNDDIVQVSKDSHGGGVWKELLIHPTPTVRHILMAAIGIHFFQQASGIDAVVLYSPRIFEKAGIVERTPKLLATIAVGFVKTIFILVATFFLDKVGRRPLLLSSVAGMILSLMSLGIGLTIIDHSDHKIEWAIALCIATILSYVAFFSIGMGPITWVYSSEIFPLRLRAQGCSMGVAMNRVVSGVIGMTFISLFEAITIGGAFFLFTGVAIVGFVFFYTLYPETRGKNLEEVEEVFGTFFRWRTRQAELDRAKEAEMISKKAQN